MARGRFVSKEISIDKKVNSLSSPWSMLAFTWLLTNADVSGRIYGDPAVVRSIVFPRQSSVSVEDVEGFIREWDDCGLINWYEAEGDLYIEFPNFSKHQVGLRSDKEPKSTIPPRPTKDGKPTDIIRNDGDNVPAEVKLREVEVEDKESEDVVIVSPDGDNNDPPPVEPLLDSERIIKFAQLACIDLSIQLPSVADVHDWIASLDRMRASGVTEPIMRQAIRELTEKKFRIKSPSSIEKTCMLILGDRNRKTMLETRPRDSEGRFAEYFNV